MWNFIPVNHVCSIVYECKSFLLLLSAYIQMHQYTYGTQIIIQHAKIQRLALESKAKCGKLLGLLTT